MATASDGYVLLRGGLAVPVAPVLLLLDLEARGLMVSRDGDDMDGTHTRAAPTELVRAIGVEGALAPAAEGLSGNA